MARLSKSDEQLDFENIAAMFYLRESALLLFYSNINPDYEIQFFGLTPSEISANLKLQILELEYDASLSLLGAIEALFRIDYAIRCEQKDKTDISRRFRVLFSKHQYKLPLEDVIFEQWKKEPLVKPSIMSNLKGAFKYRHWLAHGRYWIHKSGKYDFDGLYRLAIEVETLPLKRG